MKCTPQKTMYSASGHVGELDDLVTLVMVPQHEDPVAERGLGPPGALHQRRVGGGRQLARAVDTALTVRIGPPAEDEERKPGLGGRHGHTPLSSN
jgi:hypothetical protein